MFRTVLVHVDNARGSESRARLAVEVARRFDARLIGLTAGVPPMPIEIYDAGMGTVAIGPEFDDYQTKQLEEEFAKSAALFKAATEGSGLETDWRAEFAPPSTAIVRTAVAADLVIVGQTRRAPGDAGTASIGDVVLRVGRPVLVVPADVAALKAENILVAWKDTPEAQRAIADALPFMKQAKTVTLAEVRDGSEPSPALAEAAGFLMSHGIAVKTETIKANGDGAENQLLDAARRGRVDLIVAGAYGHSRVREWAFGGVTRGLLTQAPIVCLFSH